MILKSLKLHGFKTFHDKTLLYFDSGITVVVGPNGSGKSNISDAVRWVMGEQSAKVLRCGKMEDVIFSGTPSKKPLGFAQVSLVISDPENKLGQDTSEVEITRRYYRSGESEYLINEKNVRLRDIHEMFMDTGLGKDGYSVIGQGKIDSIVASKSEDRREIFEEAAGISRFRYRKADAEARLENAKANLLRLLDILNDLERRVGPLQKQAEKAEAYVKIANEKKNLEISLWIFTLEQSSSVIKENNEKLNLSRAQYDTIEADLQKINYQTEETFMKSNECIAKVDECRREIENTKEQIAQMRSDISVKQNDISHNDENILRCEAQIREASTLEKTFGEQVSEKEQQIKLYKVLVAEKEKVLDEKTDAMISLQDKMNVSSDQVKFLANEISNLSVQLSNEKVSVMTASSSIEDLSGRIVDLEEEIKLFQQNVKTLEIKISENKTIAQSMESEINKYENILSGFELKLENRKEKFGKMKNKRDSLSLDCEDKIRRIRLLQELDRNMEGFAQSVKAVIKESKRGILSGIHDPVSRIVDTDTKYSLAIGTALGAVAQNIVVDTDQDAKRAIKFLQQRNIGRATFLPLNTIKGYELDETKFQKYSGFVGLASKLCTVSEQYRDILQYFLGKVVVVQDIDSAIIIARDNAYKVKIVTLDGQMINAGGSLTGGAQMKNINIISRAGEIKQLQSQYDDLKQQAKNISAMLSDMEDDMGKLEASVLGNRADMIHSKQEHANVMKELHRLDFELSVAKKSLIEKSEFKSNYAKKISDLKKTKTQSEQNVQRLQEKIRAFEKKMSMESGVKETLVSERESLSCEIQEIKLEIFSAKKDIDVCQQEIQSIISLKQNSKQKVADLGQQIQIIKGKTETIQEQINQSENEIKKLVKKQSKCEAEIEKYSKSRMQFEKKITQFRQNEREKSNEKEIISKEITKLEERKVNLQKEYDTIIAKLWDEYELTRSEACMQYNSVINVNKAQHKLSELKSKIKSFGNVNVSAIEEYKEVSDRYNFLKAQVEDVEKSRDELCRLIKDLTDQMREMFLMKFNVINENFKQSFKDLFGGGHANLEFTDSDDVLSSGIEIQVSPPGKIVKRLESLSGGERALVAIALYFAIMQVNPPPFCVLDEIEAALDEVNVIRFASYLRKINDNTQFIAISHRRGTMEEADVLYGVTMQDEGISKLLKMEGKS